jgi:hypothetical protein
VNITEGSLRVSRLRRAFILYVCNFATLRETEIDDWLEMFGNNLWLLQKS